jgi:hypothetical protein
MKHNNKNLTCFFFAHLIISNFYNASTLYNEFMVHRFVTPDHRFATLELGFYIKVMIMCLLLSVDTILVPMLHCKTQKKIILKCKHSYEMILLALECGHLDYCILSGTLCKLQPCFAHE